MNIFHYYPKVLPVKKYGGTQRIAVNLMKEQANMGHRVYLLSLAGTHLPSINVMAIKKPIRNVEDYVPRDVDIIQLYGTPREIPRKPYLVRIGGNGKPGEKFMPNTVFVSKNHAMRHGSTHYIYSGINLDDFIYREKKERYFLFLAKVSWKVKNVELAIKLAKVMGFTLIVAGGWRLSFRRNVKFVGEVNDKEKAKLLAGARALIFPTNWEEPIGNVTLEALASGTPVITTNRGAMPEVVTSDVGFRCDTFEQFKEAIERIDEISPRKCRERVEENFTARIMTEKYIKEYERIIQTGSL
ncbi:glycosyltransferase [bacterium]|nr:glycosyltransferase [bacterium]NIN92425.1 glycosyltransferase [bacterium]NIO18539.1 glycosyltransferase [bacterium]NIO73535.1 glycosyltransferase [bacterium]